MIFKISIQMSEKVLEEMALAGIKPNLKTYTTLIKGWARASHPEKGLQCFKEMKSAGFFPDRAAYHCLMTSLLSRATTSEGHIYVEIVNICKEMSANSLTVDLRTAAHWSRCLRTIERRGGELTEALQRIFPPDWSSQEVQGAIGRFMGGDEGEGGEEEISEFCEGENEDFSGHL
jgi:pentatricopeptide repeat protein